MLWTLSFDSVDVTSSRADVIHTIHTDARGDAMGAAYASWYRQFVNLFVHLLRSVFGRCEKDALR
eukprot:1181541-Prorocentrum_minimum.AAC.3